MKILSASQTREWDAFTILHEPIASIDLMEKAATACAEELVHRLPGQAYCIVCGTGNNGGDGLAIARMLSAANMPVRVWVAGNPMAGSSDFKVNYERIRQSDIDVMVLAQDESELPAFRNEEWIIDALFGSGISRPAEGWHARLIAHMNNREGAIVSIDVPSGFQPDLYEFQITPIVQATFTLTFQRPLPALLFEENQQYAGEWRVLDIGLSPEFPDQVDTVMHMLTPEEADNWIPLRHRFGDKNAFGHVQVIAGSRGKMGAAVLCAHAAMRAGAGMVTGNVPLCGYDIIQTALPEAMCIPDEGTNELTSANVFNRATAIAIGPGIGTAPETALAVRRILNDARVPLVIDADALNLIAHRDLLSKIPAGSILTPHAREFDRLFGAHVTHISRFHTLREKATELGVHIVLKGPYTFTATATGKVWVNFTGNQGMATAGSGDVLTGMIAALAARGIESDKAAIAGVYLHGLAGDVASMRLNSDQLIARDIIEAIPGAFHEIRQR
jgi:NAD(P)H-hydrate epimerase